MKRIKKEKIRKAVREKEERKEREKKKKTPLQVRRLFLLLMHDIQGIELNDVDDKIARDIQFLSIYTGLKHNG